MKLFISDTAHLAATMPYISGERSRYYINGVAIQRPSGDKEGLLFVAIDGHRMSVAYDPDAKGEGGDWPEDGYIIKIDTKFRKELKRPRRTAPRSAELDLKTKQITVKDSDGATVAVGLIEVIDGSFPTWRRVIPGPVMEDSKTDAVGFDVNYLGAWSQVTDAYGVTSALCLSRLTATGPCLVTCGEPNWFGLLMPMQFENSPVPNWAE